MQDAGCGMISVQKARKLIVSHIRALGGERVSLGDALGRVLSADVRAPHPFPLFDVSAMDGFAVRSKDCRKDAVLKLAGTLKAGDAPRHVVKTGQAIRIMTGAAIPMGADS